jgi:hypothetical protein
LDFEGEFAVRRDEIGKFQGDFSNFKGENAGFKGENGKFAPKVGVLQSKTPVPAKKRRKIQLPADFPFGIRRPFPKQRRRTMANYDTPGLLYDSGVLYDEVPAPQPTRKKMAKPKLALNSLTIDQTISLANVIKTAMTANANFTTPNPTLASLGTIITTMQTNLAAFNSAKAALDSAMNNRDTALASLRATLTQLAAYVENVSAGDKTKIESAGMSTRADAAAVGPMPQVANLVVTAGDLDGTPDASWDFIKGAGSYEVQTSVDPVSGTTWAFKTISNKSSCSMNGFTTGNRIWTRVRAIGADNAAGPWSDPAVKTVP